MGIELNPLSQPVGRVVPNWSPVERPKRQPMDGAFCRLEPLCAEAHAPQLFEANRLDPDGHNWTYLPYGPFSDLDEYARWVRIRSADEDPLFFAVVDKGLNRATGVAGYLRIDPANGCIEVGHINYSPLLKGTRAATEAMFLMMKQAFSLGYRRYDWKCDALNAASRRAALRLGFSFEGIFRQAVVVKGRNRDTAWFSIIDSEWPSLEGLYRRWLSPGNFDQRGTQKIALSELTATLRR